jgi:heme-degrading monooxygenase HmoA
MPVTEFAILPLTHLLTKESLSLPVSLVEKLQTAKSVLETASKYPFHYFQQVEDPSIIYIIGKWDSPAAHEKFLPSPENQQLLEMLKDDISTEGEKPGKKMSMWHLDVDVFDISRKENSWVFEAPVISCNRHFVAKDKKEGFKEKFNEVRYILEDFTKPYSVAGGWRIEKESPEKEEWVLFSGFESVNHHMEFAKTEGFARYREIVDFVEGFEVRHLRAIEGL